MREQRRQLHFERYNAKEKERADRQQDRNTDLRDSASGSGAGARPHQGRGQGQSQAQPRFYQIKAGEEFRSFGDVARKQKLQK